MMDWTDRRCRAFHRVLTRRARLYTEMVTADAVVFGPRERLIGFDPSQHPVALQLGGAEPARLAEASRIGAEFGYNEINLNCGCPSDRVQSGRFGACLMREPDLVAECVAAMVAAVDVPVTVKCRIGVDPELFGEPAPIADSFEAIEAFMPTIARGLERGERLHDYTRHLHGLFAGRPGARAFRQVLATEAVKRGAGLEVLRDAVSRVERSREYLLIGVRAARRP